MYTDDYDGKFFFFHDTENKNDVPMKSIHTSELWFIVMWPYWNDCKDIMLCPSATKPGPLREPDGIAYGSTFRTWWHIYKSPYGRIEGSYGLNIWVYDTGSDRGIWFPAKHAGYEFWGTCLAKGAGNVPVFFDCSWFLYDIDSSSSPPPYEDIWDVTCHMNRHNGGINMLFLDWSVRKVGLKEPWTLKWHRQFDTAGWWTKAGGSQPEDWPQWMRRFKDY
jgi:prepilin-type processing-associated H-X9-DG protein